MAEVIDIYDANLLKVGQEERLRAHIDGLWHTTFHLWIVLVASPGFVLYQLRSPTAKNYPNLLDITAAGHLLSGERVQEGIREAKEELGMDIAPNSIHTLGWRVEVADQDNGQKNREHQAVHMVALDTTLDSFRPDPAEVYGLVQVPIEDGLQLHAGSLTSLECPARLFDPATKQWRDTTEVVTSARFLTRIQPYYRTVHIMAERLWWAGAD